MFFYFLSIFEIALYHIADAINVNNNLKFSMRSEISDCDVSLDDLTDINLVNEISVCNIEDTIKYIGVTNSNGKVIVTGTDTLAPGGTKTVYVFFAYTSIFGRRK